MHIFWFQILLALGVTTLLGLLTRRTLGKLENHDLSPDWLKSLCKTSYIPVAWLIWGYGLLLSVKIVSHHTEMHIPTDIVMTIGSIFFVLTITWILFNWKNSYETLLKKKLKTDNLALIFALSRIFSVVLIVISALIILEIVGIPLTALLAFGGLGGIAIGLAAKDVIVNLFGGLMIHVNRPFVVGDQILSSNKNFEGIVEQIGWYMTKIRTLDRRPTFIPNSIISEAIIENTGRMYNREIKETLGLRYEDADKTPLIVNQIETLLQKNPHIDQNQQILVDLVSLGEIGLNIELSCFTKTTNTKEWRRIRQNIFLEILKIISENNAVMSSIWDSQPKPTVLDRQRYLHTQKEYNL